MNRRVLPIILLFLLALGSCTSFKNVLYFQDKKQKTIVTNIPNDTLLPHRIDFGDVFSLSFNTPLQTATTITTNNLPVVLQVKADSTIEIPTLGKVKIIGLTVAQANDTILQRARIYFNQPFVNLLFISFKITVLGEVNNPGTKILSTENATFTDALSSCGDLKDFANRQNIKLIRGDSTYYLDLTDIKVMKAKAFNLQSNDIIYVQPLRKKNVLSNFQTTFTFLSVLNIVATLTTVYIYLRK